MNRKSLVYTLLLLVTTFFFIFLTACQQDSLLPSSLSSTNTPNSTFLGPDTSLPDTTADPTNQKPSSNNYPPPLLYIQDHTLFELKDVEITRSIPLGTDLGDFLDKQFLGDTVFLLREAGIQLINLSEGTVNQIGTIDPLAESGTCFFLPGSGEIHCKWHRVNMSLGPHDTTIVGYSLAGELLWGPFYFDHRVHLYGQTADRSGVYIVPRGQDPAIGIVQIVNVDDGTIRKGFRVEGYAEISNSPNGRFFVTVGPVERTIHLYDMIDDPLIPTVSGLPQPPSNAKLGPWTEDSQYIFFTLRSGRYTQEDQQKSLGLWRIASKTGAFKQLVLGQPNKTLLETTSRNGHWLLLRYSEDTEAARFHAPTENLEPLTLPPAAVPTHEDYLRGYFNILDDDGQWLILYKHESQAFSAINLLSGSVLSLPLPSGLVFLGWK